MKRPIKCQYGTDPKSATGELNDWSLESDDSFNNRKKTMIL